MIHQQHLCLTHLLAISSLWVAGISEAFLYLRVNNDKITTNSGTTYPANTTTTTAVCLILPIVCGADDPSHHHTPRHVLLEVVPPQLEQPGQELGQEQEQVQQVEQEQT